MTEETVAVVARPEMSDRELSDLLTSGRNGSQDVDLGVMVNDCGLRHLEMKYGMDPALGVVVIVSDATKLIYDCVGKEETARALRLVADNLDKGEQGWLGEIVMPLAAKILRTRLLIHQDQSGKPS